MSSESSGDASRFKETLDDIRTWIEKRLELFILTVNERVTFILADALQRILGILLLAGGLMFAWFALSFLISEWVGSYALGFLIASLPLILVGFIFVMIQPVYITDRIQQGMLKQFLMSFESALSSDRTSDKSDKEEKKSESADSDGPGSRPKTEADQTGTKAGGAKNTSSR